MQLSLHELPGWHHSQRLKPKTDLELMQEAALHQLKYSERPNIAKMFLVFCGRIALKDKGFDDDMPAPLAQDTL